MDAADEPDNLSAPRSNRQLPALPPPSRRASLLATAGNDDGNGGQSAKRIYNPYNGEWEGQNVGGLSDLPSFYDRGSEATSVLLPLVPPHYRVRNPRLQQWPCYSLPIDVNDTPTWVETEVRKGDAAGRPRDNACATLLPTGQVLLTGGWPGNYNGADDIATATRRPELYTPGIDWESGEFTEDEEWETEEWVTLDELRQRGAAIIPWPCFCRTAGSGSRVNNRCRTAELRDRGISPAYVGESGRPTISNAPANISYNMSFKVNTPQANRDRPASL